MTHVTLTHPALQLQLLFNDTVDFYRTIFLRHVVVTNLADTTRDVRLFFHYDWHIWNDVDANTVFYYPYSQGLVAYKLKAYFLMSGQVRLFPPYPPDSCLSAEKLVRPDLHACLVPADHHKGWSLRGRGIDFPRKGGEPAIYEGCRHWPNML